jgi:dienelactone hydrolase
VIFAHGSGSTRHTYRNCDVATHLQSVGFATLLFNLLTRAEEAQECIEPRLRHDIPLLARRVVATAHWLRRRPEVQDLRIGLFGASTGATAAILAAAELRGTIEAIVSRGGRPDLAGGALERTLAPTLLVVGEWDDAVLHGNREALTAMRCEKLLEVIPHATHRFEEPGAITRVADLAADWFGRHLAGSRRRSTAPSGSRASSFAIS